MTRTRDWPTDDESIAWITLLQSGDMSGWEPIYQHLARPIAVLLHRRYPRIECDDLASQTMLDLWKKRYLYDRERGSVRSFLFQVAQTTAADAHRRIAAERWMSPEVKASLGMPPIEEEPSPLVVQLERELATLSPMDHEILSASITGNYANELGKKYGVSPESIRVRANRLRNRLKAKLSLVEVIASTDEECQR